MLVFFCKKKKKIVWATFKTVAKTDADVVNYLVKNKIVLVINSQQVRERQ